MLGLSSSLIWAVSRCGFLPGCFPSPTHSCVGWKGLCLFFTSLCSALTTTALLCVVLKGMLSASCRELLLCVGCGIALVFQSPVLNKPGPLRLGHRRPPACLLLRRLTGSQWAAHSPRSSITAFWWFCFCLLSPFPSVPV